jgi:hypothetical protein
MRRKSFDEMLCLPKLAGARFAKLVESARRESWLPILPHQDLPDGKNPTTR